MKLLAVVVTYYPERDEAINNIKQYIDYVDKLIVWVNTPLTDQESYVLDLPEYTGKIVFKTTGRNEGMAYALNRCVEWGVDNGYSHLLTMDQDSYWLDFKGYKNTIDKYRSGFKIFCPNINNCFEVSSEVYEVPASITSGTVYDLTLFKEIGLFREDYFIDAVDIEICYRARKYSYPTVCLPNIHLSQKFASPTKQFGFTTSNYNDFRTYYIIRNHIKLWREYPEMIESKLKKRILGDYFFKRIVKIILAEKSKYKKLKSLFKGFYQGVFTKL